MDTTNNQSIGDDEINQMLANLKKQTEQMESVSDTEPQKAEPKRDHIDNSTGSDNTDSNINGDKSSSRPVVAPLSDNKSESVKTTTARSNDAAINSVDFAKIRKQAIAELRPLVGNLELPPQEKFEALLLLIRTTDDNTLIPMAYRTAMAIPDEGYRAQALLDIIKEVDFFTSNS